MTIKTNGEHLSILTCWRYSLCTPASQTQTNDWWLQRENVYNRLKEHGYQHEHNKFILEEIRINDAIKSLRKLSPRCWNKIMTQQYKRAYVFGEQNNVMKIIWTLSLEREIHIVNYYFQYSCIMHQRPWAFHECWNIIPRTLQRNRIVRREAHRLKNILQHYILIHHILGNIENQMLANKSLHEQSWQHE